jgi:hypothetical protein
MLEFAIEFSHLQRAGGDLLELLGLGAVGTDGATELGERGGSTNRCQPRCWRSMATCRVRAGMLTSATRLPEESLVKMEASLPERAARVRFGQRLASENDIALVQFVRVA